jgi:hypothetical protein
VTTDGGGKTLLPVINSALLIAITAWQISIERSHTHAPAQAIVTADNLALVIRGTLVEVVAWFTGKWNALADTKIPQIRLHYLAESWALVTLSKVVVLVVKEVLSAGCASFTWLRNAEALIGVATARARHY